MSALFRYRRGTALNLTLGQKLRVLRARKGLTIRRVSESAGISVPVIIDLEKDRSNPHDYTLAKLADLYGASLEELIVLKDQERDGPNGVG